MHEKKNEKNELRYHMFYIQVTVAQDIWNNHSVPNFSSLNEEISQEDNEKKYNSLKEAQSFGYTCWNVYKESIKLRDDTPDPKLYFVMYATGIEYNTLKTPPLAKKGKMKLMFLTRDRPANLSISTHCMCTTGDCSKCICGRKGIPCTMMCTCKCEKSQNSNQVVKRDGRKVRIIN